MQCLFFRTFLDSVSQLRKSGGHQGCICFQMKKDAMDSQERAIAIRTLLVSTGREGPEAALSHAIEDVERYRRKKRRDIALHKQIDTLK